MTERTLQELRQEKLEHPSFAQPNDATVRVWRYMDLARFVWMLENSKLFLARLNALGDPHEGSWPGFLAAIRDQQILELSKGKPAFDSAETYERVRKAHFVSCWRYGNEESEAMWRLYCPNENGVAIQTTYEKLFDSICKVPGVFMGCVRYIDYQCMGFPIDNLLHPMMHKRLSFAHEQEVRLVKHVSKYMAPEIESPAGLEIDWQIETIAENIFVNPYAAGYYYEAVKAIVRQFRPELVDRVVWSQMRAAPVF